MSDKSNGESLFVCSACGSAWPENYCPACARTIQRPPAQPLLSHAPPAAPPIQPESTISPDKTAAQRASAVKICLWWFGALIALDILLFWAPFVIIGIDPGLETKFTDFIFDWGMPFIWALAIYPMYKLFRMATYEENFVRFAAMAGYGLLILIPFTTALAFVLLFKKTLGEAPLNICPICGNPQTGKAIGKDKAILFHAFANRRCRVCDTVWRPGCPKWVAVVCIVAGLTLFFLEHVMDSLTPDKPSWASKVVVAIFALPPISYGVAVLLGRIGKMRILSTEDSDSDGVK